MRVGADAGRSSAASDALGALDVDAFGGTTSSRNVASGSVEGTASVAGALSRASTLSSSAGTAVSRRSVGASGNWSAVGSKPRSVETIGVGVSTRSAGGAE